MYFEPTDELNELLDGNDRPVDAMSIWEVKHNFNVTEEIDALLASANSELASPRKIQKTILLEVLNRAMERNAHAFSTPEVFEMLVMREVSDFASCSVSGNEPSVTSANNDLLPFGHPNCSADFSNFSDEFVREHQIEWKSSDPRIAEEYRPLVASAMRAPNDSLEKKYIITKLELTPTKDVPRDLIISIFNDNQ
jgi:hypothetical protein